MKKVITAGLFGGVALMVWTFVVNGILRFQVNINMKTIPAERQVYETLKEHIVEPGRYACNPALTSDWRFPDGEPVFSVFYGGMGHEAAGSLMLVGLVLFFLGPTIGAWMLSQASESVLCSYPRKVLFFTAIGVLVAVFCDLSNFGIGGYPLKDALILAGHDVLIWTFAGLVVAWRMKPERGLVTQE
jgi:hypothetical protein